MKAFCLPVIFLLAISTTYAQSPLKNPFRGAELAGAYTSHFPVMSAFNHSLVTNKLPALETRMSAVGVTGGVFLNSWWFGGEAAWQFGANGSNSNYTTELFGGNGMVKAGYVMVSLRQFTFYPTLGLGGGGMGITVNSATGGSVIDEGMIEPGSNLYSSYMLVDPGINADFFFGQDHGPSRLLLGFSAGWLLSPFQSRWSYGNESVPSLKKFAPQGLYFKVKLGWNKVK